MPAELLRYEARSRQARQARTPDAASAAADRP
jgi:hypothetical protein